MSLAGPTSSIATISHSRPVIHRALRSTPELHLGDLLPLIIEKPNPRLYLTDFGSSRGNSFGRRGSSGASRCLCTPRNCRCQAAQTGDIVRHRGQPGASAKEADNASLAVSSFLRLLQTEKEAKNEKALHKAGLIVNHLGKHSDEA